MGILDKLRGELVDIIEWIDDSQDLMVWRFERYQNEIKSGAKLTVREGQVAVFVNEGRIADVFKPGMYTLETENLPILSTLMGWPHGFNSPFKAEVYFLNTKNFTDLKWGTKNPIMLRDPEFGPVRLRAFGTYAMRVGGPSTFIKEIVGTDGHFTTDEITGQLRNLIVSRFTDALGEAKVPMLDLAAHYDELSGTLHVKIKPEFAAYGIELTKFLIENVSLPEAVEKALDQRSSMGVIGNMGKFQQYQSANAMVAAAENPSGDAGAGIGMGMGFAMANQMLNQQNQQQNQAQQPPGAAPGGQPPPLPGAASAPSFFAAVNGQQVGPFTVAQLQQMVQAGTVTGETLVWAQGMAGWEAASGVQGLSGLFITPPPIPG